MDSAQGSAPVFSPCGIAGGNPFGVEGCEGGEDDFCTWGGYQYGPDARTIDLKARFLSVFTKSNSSIKVHLKLSLFTFCLDCTEPSV